MFLIFCEPENAHVLNLNFDGSQMRSINLANTASIITKYNDNKISITNFYYLYAL